MYAWEAIQKSIDYVEDNLSDDIKIETLSTIASLSPYYYQRLFSRLIKKTVYEYIKLRRLAKASELLKKTERRITDIAFECGFSDHARLTHAFKATYGLTPRKYREDSLILNQFVKPDLLLKYATIKENVPMISDGIVLEVSRKKLHSPRTFIGIHGKVSATDLGAGKSTGISTIGEMWVNFHRHKMNSTQIIPNGNQVGILYEDTKGCGTYLTGVEVKLEATEEGYTTFVMPCGEYVVCSFEAENFQDLTGLAISKAILFMNNWMRENNLICGEFVTEMYYDSEVKHMELWVPIIYAQDECKSTTMWNKMDESQRPSMKIIDAYVNNPLWKDLCEYLEVQYQVKPIMEYSRCSMQAGWNVKYKKSGRSLCTLYPMEGFFIVLVVIGEHERVETEFALPSFTEYVQQLFHDTKSGMGQKWLMIEVIDKLVLDNVKQCIAIRKRINKEKSGGKKHANSFENKSI